MKFWVASVAMSVFLLPLATSKAAPNDIDKQACGVWKLKMMLPTGEEAEPIVLIGHQHEKYCAWYVGKSGLEAFKNVQLKGDALTGTLKPKDEPGVTVTVVGKMASDKKCAGTIRYQSEDGDTGEFDFTGQQIDVSAVAEMRKWKLEFVTPDNESHSPTVYVVEQDDKFHAWYSDESYELPAAKITVDGQRVEMTIVVETKEGQTVKVVFRGTVDSNETAIKGEAEFDLEGTTGEFPFSGKDVS